MKMMGLLLEKRRGDPCDRPNPVELTDDPYAWIARSSRTMTGEIHRGAGEILLPGELGVSPSFFKIPHSWGIQGVDLTGCPTDL